MKSTKKYNFCVDKISTDSCSGWYARKDGAENLLVIGIRNRQYKMPAILPRDDVEKAGLGVKNCGFEIKFQPPLKNGDKFTIRTINNEVLQEIEVKSSIDPSDQNKNRLAALVEPFVELDMQKAKSAFLGNKIFEEYKNMYRQGLAFKEQEDLKSELVDILADMKATMHLLCAAYLDQCRQNTKSGIASILDKPYEPEGELLIDMRGDITGQGWEKSDTQGRWLDGSGRATLNLPSLSIGLYQIQLEITSVSPPDLLKDISMHANNIPVMLETVVQGPISVLNGRMVIIDQNNPTLSLQLDYLPTATQSQDQGNNACKLRIKSLSLQKIKP